ncbi:MAG: cell envelope biogenesis protein OmpA [Proteobacteria bacterium]|nr:MAG: cell envelope biogenesis protein OmpA [Pseudomonadota bacterium]
MTKGSILILFTAAIVGLAGCEGATFGNREAGALTGGALGAGLGAIIGNQVGDTGAGIAIGSAAGLLAGGLIGNELDNTEQSINERDARLSQQERELEQNRQLIEELKRRGADVRDTERGIVVNLPDVLFEFGSSQLTGPARLTVKDIAEIASDAPRRQVAVEGHTDSVGSIGYNQRLSEDRARSVANELADNGVQRGRLKVRGYGKTRPIASNSTASGRQRNRRVEVIIEK